MGTDIYVEETEDGKVVDFLRWSIGNYHGFNVELAKFVQHALVHYIQPSLLISNNHPDIHLYSAQTYGLPWIFAIDELLPDGGYKINWEIAKNRIVFLNKFMSSELNTLYDKEPYTRKRMVAELDYIERFINNIMNSEYKQRPLVWSM